MDGIEGLATEGTLQMEGADTDVAGRTHSESNPRKREPQIVHLWPGSSSKDTKGI